VLTNVVQIAVVSSDQFLLTSSVQGLRLEAGEMSGLCLRPDKPKPVTGFALGIPDLGSTWEMEVQCWIVRWF